MFVPVPYASTSDCAMGIDWRLEIVEGRFAYRTRSARGYDGSWRYLLQYCAATTTVPKPPTVARTAFEGQSVAPCTADPIEKASATCIPIMLVLEQMAAGSCGERLSRRLHG
jgi:hypothetical protein